MASALEHAPNAVSEEPDPASAVASSGEEMHSGRHSLLDRLLSITNGPEDVGLSAKLLGFQLFLLGHLTASEIAKQTAVADEFGPFLAIGFAICFLAGLNRKTRHVALFAATLMQLSRFVADFPGAANHYYIELTCIALLAFGYRPESKPDREQNEHSQAETFKWLPLIVLLYSGLQKLLYGTYFNGVYLGFMIRHDERFSKGFRWFFSEETMERLQETAPEGPFRLLSAFELMVSNASYLGEIAAGVGLLFARTRKAAAIFAIVLVASIEFVALEVFFGLLFASLMMFYFRRPWVLWLFPVFLLIEFAMIGTRYGLFAEVDFN